MINHKICKHCGKKFCQDSVPTKLFANMKFCNRTCMYAWHNIARAKKRATDAAMDRSEKERWKANNEKRKRDHDKPFGWETRYLNPYLKLRFS